MSSQAPEAFAHRGKRVKFSTDDSSEPSISDASAFAPTSVGDQSTDASVYDSETDSELSESSEEPSDDSSSEEESEDSDEEMEDEEGQDGIVNLRANRGKKPTMKIDKEELGSDIRDFLRDFLPQLKAANEELEAQKKAGTLKTLDTEAGDDGEPYIEMDLGLGVLEAKELNASDSSDSESDESGTPEMPKEKDILSKLMGHERSAVTAGIEVVEDSTNS